MDFNIRCLFLSACTCVCQDKCTQYWPEKFNEEMDLRYDLKLKLVEQTAYAEYKLKRMVLVNVILRTTLSVKHGKRVH